MNIIKTLVLAACCVLAFKVQAQTMSYANNFDRERAAVFQAREQDWRNGPVVYQVLVDRFAPSDHLDAKRALYPPPKVLKAWSDEPRAGAYLPQQRLYAQELEFWGGDLKSLAGRLDHVQQLGADVLYLNPIHLAYTNHKYDALDYLQISPEYGTRADVKALAAELHRRGMKLVLDGVFNHMGRNSPYFKEAEADPASPYRDWFVFGPQYPGGARPWAGFENLPELNLENPKVREYVWAGPDSVVRSYLRDGIDGWRLDVAFDIGFALLAEITAAAHAEKPGSLVLGEIANYPREWMPSVDGLLHFMLRQLLLRTAGGKLDAAQAQRLIDRMIADTGVDNLLKSWIYLDNHDTPRLASVVPDEAQRRVAQILQFTLPGSPNLYYGSEVGMTGNNDPETRGPMRWDRVAAGHPQLAFTQQLIRMRHASRALRIGDYRPLVTQQLLAFERHTERAADAVFVLANPSDRAVTELVMLPDSKVMDGTRFIEMLGQVAPGTLSAHSALLEVTLPPRTVYVLRPDVAPRGGYTNYKRVQ